MLEDLLPKLDVSRSKTTTSGFVISAVLIAIGAGRCKGVVISGAPRARKARAERSTMGKKIW